MNLSRLISGLRTWASAWRGEQWTPPAYCQTCSMSSGRPHCFWCPHARPLAEAAPHDHDRDLDDDRRQAQINALRDLHARDADRYLDACDRFRRRTK